VADNTEEIRFKVSKGEHAVFHGIARARGLDASDLARTVFRQFLEVEARVAKLIVSYIPSEGIVGNGNGKRSAFDMPDPIETEGEG